jgi:hypothetical protein
MSRHEPSWTDLRGNDSYYNFYSGPGVDGDDGVYASGGVLVRYTIDLTAIPGAGSAAPVPDYNLTVWSGGGDVEDWAVINCFLTATDTAWASGSMIMNLGDGGTPPYDDLIDAVVVNNSTSARTRPHSPNYNSPSYFGSARRHYYTDHEHTAWPVTIGGAGNYSIFSTLAITLDNTTYSLIGPITNGFIIMNALLLPLKNTPWTP